MTIQFNLLPDVKIEFIRARRLKRSMLLIAGSITVVSVTVMVLLFLVVGIAQKKHLSDLNKDVATLSNTLQSNQDLNKILTIQNQMATLPRLHQQKPVVKRLFMYVQQITPKGVQISSLNIDFAAHTMSIGGTADTISTVNTYVDTLKFTNYTTADDSSKTPKPAFSNVVLGSFSPSQKQTAYQITLSFDQVIFQSDKDVALTVPSITSTRSDTERPQLFNGTTPSTTTTTTKAAGQ